MGLVLLLFNDVAEIDILVDLSLFLELLINDPIGLLKFLEAILTIPHKLRIPLPTATHLPIQPFLPLPPLLDLRIHKLAIHRIFIREL